MSEQIWQLAVTAATEKKAKEVIALDLRGKSTYAIINSFTLVILIGIQ